MQAAAQDALCREFVPHAIPTENCGKQDDQ